MKNNNDAICTWGACCEYILQKAQLREDFVLVLPESDFDLGRLRKLPEEKIFRASSSERGAVLSAAGLALEGKKPWIAASLACGAPSGTTTWQAMPRMRAGFRLATITMSLPGKASGW